MKNLKDKIVFITGAAQGLGYSMAEHFAAEGCKVILADIKADKVVESANKIAEQYNVETMGITIDVSSVAAIEEAFAKVKEKYGTLNVLVNCAGIQIRCPSVDFPEDKYDKVLDINLKGTFFCCQQAARLMGENGGAIVNISSGNSTRPTPGRAPYAISKAGVNALTKVFAAEWGEAVNGKKPIRVNAIAPGFIATELLLDGLNSGIISQRQIEAVLPYRRMAEPAEIADVAVFLASDEARYVTGQTLFADGGWTALGLPHIDLIKE